MKSECNNNASIMGRSGYACIMQGIGFNGVVSKKIQRNFRIPSEIVEAFEGTFPDFPEKKRWFLYASAMLLFVDITHGDRQVLVQRVMGAESFRTIGELVEQAKMGRLLDEANPNRPAAIGSDVNPREESAEAPPAKLGKPRGRSRRAADEKKGEG